VKRISTYTLAELAILLAVAVQVYAGSSTGNMAISASVTNTCSITNSPSISFGSYSPLAGTDLDVNGTISVACTKGTVATITLDAGGNSTHAVGTTRAMVSGTNYLSYEIYSNSGLTTVWGTGANGVQEPAAPSKAAVNYTAFGRVPNSQDVPAGSYSDSVNITVSF
jgi:spore coat protein U domain-containing protein, fimbrial subunit CupE1/2/3/6